MVVIASNCNAVACWCIDYFWWKQCAIASYLCFRLKIIEEQLKKLIAFKHQVIEKVGEMQEQMNMLMGEEREDNEEIEEEKKE